MWSNDRIPAQPARIIFWQAVLLGITSLAVLAGFGSASAISGLIGGLISVVANLFFALRLFSNQGDWNISQITAVTYRGVLGRLFLTLSLFLLTVILLKPLNAVALFTVYFWIQISPALIVGLLNRD